MTELERAIEEFNIEQVEEVHEDNISSIGYLAVKRVMDIIISIIGLIITSPIMLITAVAIKLETPGPTIYKQTRLGKSGKEFTLYKFRSMVQNAEKHTGAVWAKEDDPRVTKVGKIIRKTRIDELPQFVNILKGEMTLIGPRPERPSLTKEFSEKHTGFKNRLLVKPGITGLAQVKGGYDLAPGQKLKYDMLYIKKRNLLLDFEIIFQTIKVLICGHGAR